MSPKQMSRLMTAVIFAFALGAVVVYGRVIKEVGMFENSVSPKVAGATYIFAGKLKRILPVLDLHPKPDTMVPCPPPLDVVAPTMQDQPTDSVSKSACDWYYKTFDTKARRKK